MLSGSVFLNRKNELEKISGLVNKNQPGQVIFCSTKPGTGLTSFLEHLSEVLSESQITFYVNGSKKIPNSLCAQVFQQLYFKYPKEKKAFENYLYAKLQKDSRGLVGTILAAVPYLAEFILGTGGVASEALSPIIKDVFSRKHIPEIQTSAFSSAIIEFVLPFLESIGQEKSIFILIDNAQDLDEWSLEFIKFSGGNEVGVRYFIGHIARRGLTESTDTEETIRKLKSIGRAVVSFDFTPPDILLIKELAQSKGYAITDADARRILKEAREDIYEIIFRLINPEKRLISKISEIQREILLYLSIARQPIRDSDLTAIITTSATIFIDSLATIEKEIDELVNTNLISSSYMPDFSRLLSLDSSSHPLLASLDISAAESIEKASRLYDYFLRVENDLTSHSKTEVTLLLYRLAKSVDKSSLGRRGQSLLSLCLKMGSVNTAQKYIDKAIDDQALKQFSDYFIKVAFHMSYRSYQKALDLLVNPPQVEWRNKRICQVLRAVAMNRCRLHKESESLIQELLKDSAHPEEAVILLSYSISGLMHENKVKAAQEQYYSYRTKLSKAKNFGYFLRNASIALSTEETEAILIESLTLFDKNVDGFGYYSTLANLGKCRYKTGKILKAEEDLEEAYRNLAIYGVNHLHIVSNNLGLCKMKLAKFAEAQKYFKEAQLYSSNLMPIAYATINMSTLLLEEKDFDNSIRLIRSIEDSVQTYSVDRLKQKFYINAAFIAYACNEPKDVIKEYCKNALKHPDRISNEITENRVNSIEKNIRNRSKYKPEMLYELFDPCTLEYWYQNPLELVPQQILSI